MFIVREVCVVFIVYMVCVCVCVRVLQERV